MPEKDKLYENKMSPGFAARLDSLGPRQRVQAIIFLRAEESKKSPVCGQPAKRQSHTERKAAIESVRKAAKQAMADIDCILENFSGQRLATSPDALGSLPVETTADGLKALAESDWVETIVEDQPIHPIR